MSGQETPFGEDNLPPNLTRAALPLPVPSLALDFRMVVDLDPLVSVGVGPFGQRNWISFSGGVFTARWGTGTVVPGGQDSQLVVAESLSTAVETTYLLKTDENDDDTPAYIAMRTTGWRTGPRDVMERLFDPARADGVAPDEYSFRLNVRMETGDERYRDLVNTAMWVGSGARLGATVVYDAYRVV
ncbi:uncharacterized protein GLRG_01748 [Colletotrichum graminicola M1.001]|uniref:Uncharacterized protein n=1 Tax=Colletotrichum graminicola (strain M1.001 / M2 / FGSC 10212) TaxID=645133 RepID=E3Q974_COLGM|nr:uncharacterized protein GLRG_01748 [Colletotrichum graminicola M1.001]EFQ27253.1 hypothetical protein GLRG_01748 [Colletotrichum graminicola M1.001]